MWEVLIPTIFSVLKKHLDEVILRINAWFLSFVLCWLALPDGLYRYLSQKALPALPPYVLVYIFLLVTATAFWQMFFILLEVIIILIEKCAKRQAVQPDTERVEIDNE